MKKLRDLCKPWVIVWIAPHYSKIAYRFWTRRGRDKHLAALRRISAYPENWFPGYL